MTYNSDTMSARSHLVWSVVPYLRTVSARGIHLLSAFHGHHLTVGQYQELGSRCVVSLAVCGFESPEVAPSKRLLVFLLDKKKQKQTKPSQQVNREHYSYERRQ